MVIFEEKKEWVDQWNEEVQKRFEFVFPFFGEV